MRGAYQSVVGRNSAAGRGGMMADAFENFYYDRAVEIVRKQGGCRRAELRDRLGLKREPEEFEAVWRSLLDRGVIVKKGRSYVAGLLPPPPRPKRPLREVVRDEFAAKSTAEKAAIAASMAMTRQRNGAAERRRAALAARRVKGL